MTVTYPLAWPSAARIIESKLWISRNQVPVPAINRRLQVHTRIGARWVGTVTFSAMTATEVADILGFFDALDGLVGSFTFPHPDFDSIQGNAPNNTGQIAGADQTGREINTDLWSASVSNLFKRGDVIQIGEKLKRVVETVASDGGGLATLTVDPGFYSAPADNERIITLNPEATFQLQVSDVGQILANHNRIHQLSVPIQEVLP